MKPSVIVLVAALVAPPAAASYTPNPLHVRPYECTHLFQGWTFSIWGLREACVAWSNVKDNLRELRRSLPDIPRAISGGESSSTGTCR